MTPELRQAAAARGLSIRQLVTLASIVEKETAQARTSGPLVAAVYANRLRIGMALQCDPTVIYALERAGRYHGNLRATTWRSTRRTTPIGIPACRLDRSPRREGRRSRRPSIPADVDYLYFVSRNDGSHEFARTLDEHNRNVQKYQVQYFRGPGRSVGWARQVGQERQGQVAS